MEGALDEFTAPDPINMLGNITPTNHLRQSRADDVVFKLDFVFSVFGFILHVGFRPIEELGQSGIEFEVGPILTQQPVVEPAEFAGEDVGQNMV